MTREEAIKAFEEIKLNAQTHLGKKYAAGCEGYYQDKIDLADAALSALRPVSRELVERIWFREPYTRLETKCGENGDIVYSAVNTCTACGHKTPIGNFCHNCGVAQTREAVEMVIEKLKEVISE